jgi:HK97 family phage major capsid protein
MTEKEALELLEEKFVTKKDFEKLHADFQKFYEEYQKNMVKIPGAGSFIQKDNQTKEIAYKWYLAFLNNDYKEIEKLANEYPDAFIQTKQLTTVSAPALVPSEVYEDIIKKVEEIKWHRKYCTVIKINAAKITIPSETTGVTGYWVSEGTPPTLEAPTITGIEFSTNECAAGVLVSIKLVEVSTPDIVDFLNYLVAKGIAKTEFTALITGNGTGKWKGLNAYTDIAQIDATGKSLYDVLVEAFSAIEEDDLDNSAWIMNRIVMGKVYKAKDTAGRPYFDPKEKAIFGLPILLHSSMGNSEMYFGNPKAYWILDQRTLKIVASSEGKDLITKRLALIFASTDSDGKLTRTEAFVKIINIA